jgi:hypothetical protein
MSLVLECEQTGGCTPQHLIAIIAGSEPAVERRIYLEVRGSLVDTAR